jgi:Right handed beta helix region
MSRHLLISLVVAALAAPAAHAYDVTTCYQTVPSGQTGVLQNDIVCDGSMGPNVNVGRHAKLLLNGHSISGGYIGIATDPGNIGRAQIRGPGEIFGVTGGGGPFGCAISTAGKASISDVTLHDNDCGITRVYNFSMKLDGVTITNNATDGIRIYGPLPSGPGKGQLTGRNLTVTMNGGGGIFNDGTLNLRDSTISGNGGDGIDAHAFRFSLHNVTVNDNGGAGLLSTRTHPGVLKKSTLTGNGAAGDIAAPVAPKLPGSTCGISVDTDSGGSLHICAGD